MSAWLALAAAWGAGFDAHGFSMPPSEPEPGAVGVARAAMRPAGAWSGAVALEYLRTPIVDVGPDATRPILEHGLAVQGSLGVHVHQRVRIDAALAMFPVTTGAVGGAGLGDLRLAAAAVLLDDERVEVAVRPWMGLPTGRSEAWLGADGVTGGADALVAARHQKLRVAGQTGLRFRPGLEEANLTGSDTWTTAVAVGIEPVDDTAVQVEARLAVPFVSSEQAWTGAPGELWLSASHRAAGGGTWFGAAGTAMTPGVGAPSVRIVVGTGRSGAPELP